MYKFVLGMSYYIHGRGLGALVDGVRPDFKGVARSAVNVLPSYNAPPDAPRPRQCQGGDFGRLQQAGIAGSGRICASQLAPSTAHRRTAGLSWELAPAAGANAVGRRKQR